MSALDELLQQLSDNSGLPWNAETYSLELAKSLSEDERVTYIAKLVDAAQEEDYLAVLTLGYLKADQALPMLMGLAKSDQPTASTARRALVAMGRGADVITEIAHDAVNAAESIERFAAVVDLPKVGGPTAIFALQQALLDEDTEVRVVAWDGLIEVLGLTKRLENPSGIRELTTEVEVLRVLLAAARTPLVKIGATGMREVARRLAAGATAQQLGIAWRPRTDQNVFDRLRDAVFDKTLPFPVEGIVKLVGSQRKLAEAMIARRLDEWDDRVPSALVDLGAVWLSPALEELGASSETPVELREKLAAAATVLRARPTT